MTSREQDMLHLVDQDLTDARELYSTEREHRLTEEEGESAVTEEPDSGLSSPPKESKETGIR